MTDLSKTQLATILSALDGERRSPANKDAALKAIGKSAERLGLNTEAVLAAAAGLLDGRLDAAVWRAQLTEPKAPPAAEPTSTDTESAPEVRQPRPREGTKEAMLIAMLRRPEGASLDRSSRLPAGRSTRSSGAISGALKKKRGLDVISEKGENGERVYRIAAE
jgi:Protein of unknown function (DUF3489)